jgi:hypothetical protein
MLRVVLLLLTDIFVTMCKYCFTFFLSILGNLKVLLIFSERCHKNYLIVLHNTKWMPNINITFLDGDLSK